MSRQAIPQLMAALLLAGGLIPAAQSEPQVCVQMIQPAVEKATGYCSSFATPCEVPSGWLPVDACPSTDWKPDYDGIWNVIAGQTDAEGNSPRYSLLSVRVTGNTAALVFLNNGAWEAFVAPFDEQTQTARVTSWNGGGYNVWSINFFGETSAMLQGERCLGAPLGGVANPFVTPTAYSGAGLPLPGSGCRVPEGSSLQLEKLL